MSTAVTSDYSSSCSTGQRNVWWINEIFGEIHVQSEATSINSVVEALELNPGFALGIQYIWDFFSWLSLTVTQFNPWWLKMICFHSSRLTDFISSVKQHRRKERERVEALASIDSLVRLRVMPADLQQEMLEREDSESRFGPVEMHIVQEYSERVQWQVQWKRVEWKTRVRGPLSESHSKMVHYITWSI